MEYDVVIIGAGPGGYVAAIRAAQLGLSVCAVEEAAVGGTCLNRGCIPTKALYASVSLLAQMRRASEYGLRVGEVAADFPAIMARKAAVVDRLVKGIHHLFKKNRITLLAGRGRLLDCRRVRVEGPGGEVREVIGRHVILATGSRPAVFPALGYDGRQVITSDEALSLEAVPASLLVVGGGAIGCEFASLFAELGSRVTVVEAMPNLLPLVDEEVSRQLRSYFKRRGIEVKTGTTVQAVEKRPSSVKVFLGSGEELEVERVLVSVGRVPNTSDLGLEEAGVEVNARGEIPVTEGMETNVPGIFAVGDVTDVRAKLAHVASRQGVVAAERIAGRPAAMDYRAVPSCVFTRPEVASVGLTEAEAEKAGQPVRVGRFFFLANGKALAMGETEGFVKVVADGRDGRVLGVHIIGPHASDLIAEGTLAVEAGVSAERLAQVIHAHPTLPEALLEAAEAAEGRAIHA